MQHSSQEMRAVRTVTDALLSTGSWKVTKYLSETRIVRVTRRLTGRKSAKGRRIDKRERNIDISLTIGRPNYLERQFIKQCKQAGEPIPVGRVQLKFPPKPRR